MQLARRLIFLAVAGALLAACTGPRTDPPKDEPIGFSGIYPSGHRHAAPAVAGELLTGGRLSVAQLRGHVVLLNFWASWCTPCQQETASLEQAFTATEALGVRFLGVNVADQPAQALAYARSHHVPYPSIEDESASLLPKFPGIPPSALPSSVILDQQGRVAATWIGAVAANRLIAVLRSLSPAAGTS